MENSETVETKHRKVCQAESRLDLRNFLATGLACIDKTLEKLDEHSMRTAEFIWRY